MIKRIDEMTPTLERQYGNAWLMDLEEMRKQEGHNPEDTTIQVYIVHAPWAHLFWFNYALVVISLAEKEGVSSAHIRKQGATHELIILALNPESVPAVNTQCDYLTPPNFCGQFIADNDEKAKEVLTNTVERIIQRGLSPDTDYYSVWQQLFPED